jgi:SAM-dependent methyltransferase
MVPMTAVLDYPTAERAIDPLRFNVRGWVWLGDSQSRIASIEAWSGEILLGQSMKLLPRPDVVSALTLEESARPGFDFFADYPGWECATDFELTIFARMRDGSRSAVLCGTRPRILRRSVQHGSARDSDGAGSGTPPRATDATRPRAAELNSDALPPDHLQIRQVGGIWGSRFYSEGRQIFGQIAETFREAGSPLEQAQRVLDFGCGCGRVLRGFEGMSPAPEVWGSDLDEEAIDWNRRHLGHIASFVSNRALPPTGFAPAFFDATYAVSVFTHLPEELQFAWLTELRRIIRPKGLLVVSTHGAHYWQNAGGDVRLEVEERGIAYRTCARTEGLPDHYMVAFHSPAYVRSRWSWFFEVVAVKEKFIHGSHDAVVLRRRDD